MNVADNSIVFNCSFFSNLSPKELHRTADTLATNASLANTSTNVSSVHSSSSNSSSVNQSSVKSSSVGRSSVHYFNTTVVDSSSDSKEALRSSVGLRRPTGRPLYVRWEKPFMDRRDCVNTPVGCLNLNVQG